MANCLRATTAGLANSRGQSASSSSGARNACRQLRAQLRPLVFASVYINDAARSLVLSFSLSNLTGANLCEREPPPPPPP